ncbi:sugar ABC transporter substrate-binding protein [Phytoactinopolyspora halotolerans]|uniref:Sugar ABC transporter substrate-binding protein n=1 Tax=Phytoactinopolyspora halotolerans TaxID=1981512 RepID=A0A6L9SD97_9ACTN|nr:sugar ABC transporter substrate-binding protein [Phytoactinopolyspora halotolerans]NEE03355.1 sugar ABC transporter substrate-binding protein [Phytoactinopolyspora halotolerans]
MNRRVLAIRTSAVVAISAVALTSCSEAGGGSDSDGGYRVAVLAASSQNGYNQAVYQGVEEAVAETGADVDLQLLDGQFDANTQLSQLQNTTTSGDYDGVIVVPNDGPGLAAAFPLAQEIPVVTVLNPIGPDIEEMEPQVEGVVSTVAVPPSEAAAKQAEGVAEYCADKDPCKAVLLVGQLNAPLDVARRDAYQGVLEQHDNVEIVATVEGNYDRDQSLTAITNVLQANRDIDAILSNADQQTSGAQVALQNAGIEPSSIYLTGGGGTKDAVTAVREGTWKADYINFPVSMGKAAFEQLHNALTGEDVESWVDADAVGDVEPYATKETLDEAPDFGGEWNG